MNKAEEDALIREHQLRSGDPVEQRIRLAIRAAVAAERERDEARELSVQGSARLFAAMNFERDEWKRKAEEAARDAANGQKIMRLLASIFYYGDFTAETANERELQAVMESAGWWPFKSEADLLAAIAAKGEA